VLLVHGSSGDEFGVIGYLFARDVDTGEEVWARPMVEGHMGRLNGKDSTPTGDPKAPSWPDDPDGNRQGRSLEPRRRRAVADRRFDVETEHGRHRHRQPGARGTPGSAPRKATIPSNWPSLFTSGQAYVDAATGELKGFFSHTPNDAWDFSGNNSVLLFEYKDPKTGKQVKASAHADRNGFFFVTDREKLATGAGYPWKQSALIGAWPFVDGITWTKGFDLKTGMPNVVESQYPPKPKAGQEKGESIFVSPPFLGGTNWMPMSYSPVTEPVLHPGQPLGDGLLDRERHLQGGLRPTWARASASRSCSTTTWASCAPSTRRPARSPGSTRSSSRCGPAR
jgi:glucose dehydrogenase